MNNSFERALDELYCAVYVSSSVWLITEPDLERLLVDARDHNKKHQVTGVLLYNDGTFFQYIEGLLDDLEYIYGRIKASKQHRGIIQLLYEKTTLRRFPDWYMGFFHPSKSEILNLANQKWWNSFNGKPQRPEETPIGLKLLENFCQNQDHFVL